jgi:hypothetical protein
MTTVKELIDYLETLPQETEVRVMVAEYASIAEYETLKFDENIGLNTKNILEFGLG